MNVGKEILEPRHSDREQVEWYALKRNMNITSI